MSRVGVSRRAGVVCEVNGDLTLSAVARATPASGLSLQGVLGTIVDNSYTLRQPI